MNEYKKLLKSQRLRFNLLRLMRFIPDKFMINLQYRIKLKKKLNLKNPKRYTEKIQWYKLHYRNMIMMQCVDKYSVREYIVGKGLVAILNKLYQVVDNPEQIDFEALPNKFIIKTTNGSGTNIICKDKTKLNIKETKNQLNGFLKMADVAAGREWAYSGSSKKIIIEQLLEDKSNFDYGVSDYKFLCFDGKPYYIVYDKDRFTEHKRNFYDTDWNYIEVYSDHPCFGDVVARPKNLDRMVEIAATLSSDFPAVRVDLFNIDGEIFFGELTFYPWSGYVKFTPDSFDYKLAELFPLMRYKVPDIKNSKE